VDRPDSYSTEGFFDTQIPGAVRSRQSVKSVVVEQDRSFERFIRKTVDY
jgi:hypothetical protein